jgi:hypothetical protein
MLLVGCSTDFSQPMPPLVVRTSTSVARPTSMPADPASENLAVAVQSEPAATRALSQVIQVLPEVALETLHDRDAAVQLALDELNWHSDRDRYLWYVVEMSSGERTMAFSEEEFVALRSKLGVPEDLKLDQIIQAPIMVEQ